MAIYLGICQSSLKDFATGSREADSVFHIGLSFVVVACGYDKEAPIGSSKVSIKRIPVEFIYNSIRVIII